MRGYYRAEPLALRIWQPVSDDENAVVVLRWHLGVTRPKAVDSRDWWLHVDFWIGDIDHRSTFDDLLWQLDRQAADPSWDEVVQVVERLGFVATEDHPQ